MFDIFKQRSNICRDKFDDFVVVLYTSPNVFQVRTIASE
jgi:hypothetical protein